MLELKDAIHRLYDLYNTTGRDTRTTASNTTNTTATSSSRVSNELLSQKDLTDYYATEDDYTTALSQFTDKRFYEVLPPTHLINALLSHFIIFFLI